MGYMADAHGMIYIRGNEKLIKMIRNYITDILYGDIIKEEDNSIDGYTEFYFSAPRDSALVNYHEEQYFGLYKLAGKACVKGRVRFNGFNGRYVYWCHNYNEDTGKWSEHEGRIVYSGLDVADGEEFINDGYEELKLPRVSREIRQRLAK